MTSFGPSGAGARPMAADLLQVYFLDVGQGDCTFIVPPGAETAPILFDCADAYVAERFVANHRIGDLGAVVVSHLDIDHIGGMLAFLKTHFEAKRRVSRLVMFPDRAPRAGRNQALRQLMGAAIAWEKRPPHDGFALKAPHRDLEGPFEIAHGADWSVELVLPFVGTAADALVDGNDANACSAVLRVTRGATSVLIGGDAPLGSWERLEHSRCSAQVIRVPHHGGEIREHGGEWTRFEDLYGAVRAEHAVVSVGTNNGHGHPLLEHAAAARRGGECRLLCTQLTPRCHDFPLSVREQALEKAGSVEWPYRHRAQQRQRTRPTSEVPCAGTVVVSIDAHGELSVLPDAGEGHGELVTGLQRPQCRAHSR